MEQTKTPTKGYTILINQKYKFKLSIPEPSDVKLILSALEANAAVKDFKNYLNALALLVKLMVKEMHVDNVSYLLRFDNDGTLSKDSIDDLLVMLKTGTEAEQSAITNLLYAATQLLDASGSEPRLYSPTGEILTSVKIQSIDLNPTQFH